MSGSLVDKQIEKSRYVISIASEVKDAWEHGMMDGKSDSAPSQGSYEAMTPEALTLLARASRRI
jgi:hypothetical protein